MNIELSIEDRRTLLNALAFLYSTEVCIHEYSGTDILTLIKRLNSPEIELDAYVFDTEIELSKESEELLQTIPKIQVRG